MYFEIIISVFVLMLSWAIYELTKSIHFALFSAIFLHIIWLFLSCRSDIRIYKDLRRKLRKHKQMKRELNLKKSNEANTK